MLARFPQIHKAHHNNKVIFFDFQNRTLQEELLL